MTNPRSPWYDPDPARSWGQGRGTSDERASEETRDRPRASPDERGAAEEQEAEGTRDRSPASPDSGGSATTVLFLHILTFLCCANWLFGVLGIVFATRAVTSRGRGRFSQAAILTRYAWYCLVGWAVFGIVLLVTSIILWNLGFTLLTDAADVGRYQY